MDGWIGIVGLFGRSATDRLRKEARKRVPAGMSNLLAEHAPHVTFVHLVVEGADRELLTNLLRHLRRLVGHDRLILRQTTVVGGKFLVLRDDRPSAALQLARLASASLGVWKKPAVQTASEDERLDLTKYQRRCLAAFGHPLVLPPGDESLALHVSLGYSEEAIDGSKLMPPVAPIGVRIERLVLAQMGPYGTVSALYDL